MRSVAPKKSLGQHFLVDRNILGVIARLAGSTRPTSRSRSGPGLGVLTSLPRRPRAARARRRARPVARAGRCGRPSGTAGTSTSTWATRSPSTSDALDPTPTKLVANLPYNVATPLVAETLTALADARVVVRDGAARGRRPLLRRAGDEGVRRRLGARPAPRACAPASIPSRARSSGRRRTSTRRSSPSSGFPLPRTPSACAASSAAPSRIAARRSRTRSRWPGSRPRGGRRGARTRSAVAADVRAEALAPERVRRARGGARAMSDWRRGAAPAKLNLALVVGPLRRDGKHEVVTVLERLSLADAVAVREARATAVPGFADDTLVARGARGVCAAAGDARRFEARIEKRIPVAAGLGGGSSDAATALELANGRSAGRRSGRRPPRSRGASSAPTCRSSCATAPQLATGDGTTLEPLAPAARLLGPARAARRRRRSRPRETSTRHSTTREALAGSTSAATRSATRSRESAARATSRGSRRTTSPRRRSRPSCASSAPSAPTSPAPAPSSTASSRPRQGPGTPPRDSRAGDDLGHEAPSPAREEYRKVSVA